MAAVSLEELSKHYRTRHGIVRAVRGLSISVADGELAVLVGPSGCGKTTTLRLVAGLEHPTAGTICIGGRPVNDVDPRDRDVAMVSQNPALYPHMGVYRNLAFGLKMRRTARSEIRRRVHTAAEQLGITGLLRRRPDQLSGGERQRVALGRAMVRRPRVFLLDEPLSDLDAQLRVQLRTEIKRLQRELATTMVYVTHDQTEAMALGDTLAVMHEGTVHQCGAPADVYERPRDRFVAGFIGTPSMNFYVGRVARQADGIHFDGAGFRMGIGARPPNRKPGEEVVLGIRPEHLLIGDRPAQAGGATGGALCNIGKGRVTLVEPLGDAAHVHVTLAEGARVTLRGGEPAGVKPGEEVTVWADASRLHWFDADAAGKRLGLS